VQAAPCASGQPDWPPRPCRHHSARRLPHRRHPRPGSPVPHLLLPGHPGVPQQRRPLRLDRLRRLRLPLRLLLPGHLPVQGDAPRRCKPAFDAPEKQLVIERLCLELPHRSTTTAKTARPALQAWPPLIRRPCRRRRDHRGPGNLSPERGQPAGVPQHTSHTAMPSHQADGLHPERGQSCRGTSQLPPAAALETDIALGSFAPWCTTAALPSPHRRLAHRRLARPHLAHPRLAGPRPLAAPRPLARPRLAAPRPHPLARPLLARPRRCQQHPCCCPSPRPPPPPPASCCSSGRTRPPRRPTSSSTAAHPGRPACLR
jgi:hypothetical protein